MSITLFPTIFFLRPRRRKERLNKLWLKSLLLDLLFLFPNIQLLTIGLLWQNSTFEEIMVYTETWKVWPRRFAFKQTKMSGELRNSDWETDDRPSLLLLSELTLKTCINKAEGECMPKETSERPVSFLCFRKSSTLTIQVTDGWKECKSVRRFIFFIKRFEKHSLSLPLLPCLAPSFYMSTFRLPFHCHNSDCQKCSIRDCYLTPEDWPDWCRAHRQHCSACRLC